MKAPGLWAAQVINAGSMQVAATKLEERYRPRGYMPVTDPAQRTQAVSVQALATESATLRL